MSSTIATNPIRPGTPLTLSRRTSFWVAAAVAAHTLWTSAAPAMTYPLYAAQWRLTPTLTTGIFAIYPVTVVLVLVLLGNLSDQIGRRNTLLMGVGASLLGTLLFALAPNVAWVFAGRVAMGVGVGLSASPASAALVEFSAAGQAQRAGVVNTAATALGMALATLVGGALITYAPFPTHLNFWVLAAVLALVFGLTWLLPRDGKLAAFRWQPTRVTVPKSLVRPFATSAIAVTAAYSMGAIYLSLGAQIAHDLIGSKNALVTGAAMALFALVTGIVAVSAKRLPSQTSVVWGGLASASGMALLALAAAWHALPVFLLAVVMAGAAYSLLFLGGLTLINAHAPAHHRAGTLSAIYLIGYLLMGAIALTLGMVATRHGLAGALQVGTPTIAALGLASVGLGRLRLARTPGAIAVATSGGNS
jgi:MFS family permease